MSIDRARELRYVRLAAPPELDIVTKAVREMNEHAQRDLVLDGMIKTPDGLLWIPKTPPPSILDRIFGGFRVPLSWDAIEIATTPPEPEFEVNMVEALVGWRRWSVLPRAIASLNANEPWIPDIPMVAICHHYEDHAAPLQHCTCGIYALDEMDTDEMNAENVWGEVYGWGRYVRGDSGWRAQYAYPKSFYFMQDSHTPEVMSVLRRYHVPIYVYSPQLAYSPEEDGYEHRRDEADWNLGALDAATAAQEGSSGEDPGDEADD